MLAVFRGADARIGSLFFSKLSYNINEVWKPFILSNAELSPVGSREKRKEYYQRNKYRLCHHKLNVYSFNTIEKIGKICTTTVNKYIERYPFEKYANAYIVKELYKYRINTSHDNYDDCYSAGMVAYLYSIHRCAYMKYSHTEAYIKKMIRIYIICALVIYDDTYNLCKENDFKEVRLDAETSQNRYCFFSILT